MTARARQGDLLARPLVERLARMEQATDTFCTAGTPMEAAGDADISPAGGGASQPPHNVPRRGAGTGFTGAGHPEEA